ncbi:PD-(D/E)XK nuclease family protein [Falsiroseomonas sp. HW251]|uniref:PD-(D/E)XK nuclease family protein n=1 Tax=Falsiroseomonas sp. HW251 TaxID=3390998 RepID=UPI003D3215DD
MSRRTVVVGDAAELDAARLDLARSDRGHGARVIPVHGLAERLAGGFQTSISSDDLSIAVREALRAMAPAALGDLAAICDLPGFRRSVVASLRRAWRADLNLAASADRHPRIAAMARVEAQVMARLPPGKARPRDLVAAAMHRLGYAPATVGVVEFRRLPDLDLCWRPLVKALAALRPSLPVIWNAGSFDVPTWVRNSHGIEIEGKQTPASDVLTFGCGGPRHEVIEALRWARKTLAAGTVGPHRVGIAAASTTPYDDMMAALAEESGLDVHFAHGRPALLTPDGQAAAALADILLRGLTQERVRRLLARLKDNRRPRKDLPQDWHRALEPDATLSTPERWELALSGEERKPIRDVMVPLVTMLAEGPDAAQEAGKLLDGPAAELWKRALTRADPAALDRELASLRVTDDNDPGKSILWSPASTLAAIPRPHGWLMGLNARSWPRGSYEDPLLPDHILGDLRPQETSITQADRASFDAIGGSGAAVVARSFSRRGPDGRKLGRSPLISSVTVQHLRRTRIPDHAMSSPDRMLARPDDFRATPEAQAAQGCWDDWRNENAITAHDGRLSVADHPAVVRALGRVQSATSLTTLIRNPIGFTWRYALGMRAPQPDEEPLGLDARAFGDLVHGVLEEAVLRLEQGSGLGSATEAEILTAISASADDVAKRWQTAHPVPPSRVWGHQLEQARETASAALLFQLPALPGQRVFVEVPFGSGQDPDRPAPRGRTLAVSRPLPWAPNASVPVPGTTLLVGGRIDRLDLSGTGDQARVIDYKTGRRRPDVQLNGGRELQRCLYAYAVGALVSGPPTVESGLLHSRGDAGFDTLAAPDEALPKLAGVLAAAVSGMRAGLCLPGVAAGTSGTAAEKYERDDLAFAHPAAPGTTLMRKKVAATAELDHAIVTFWAEP